MSEQSAIFNDHPFPNRLPNLVNFMERTFIRPFQRWSHRKAAVHDLARLSDRALADIGITRGEIIHAVYGETDGRRRKGR